MSLFSWFSPNKKAPRSLPAAESSGLSRMEATRPVTPRRGNMPKEMQPTSNAQPANRKSERMARRELLYVVVREAMVRSGVLSASYKFKVLSLDARGRQFLVMVDLARGYGGETSRLAEIEALIAQGAKARYDIIVTAVYWRMNEHVAVGLPGTTPSRPAPLDSGPVGLHSAPVPLEAAEPAPLPHSAPIVVAVAPVAASVAKPAARPQATSQDDATLPLRPGSRFEPIEADEVAAFRKALAAGISKPAAVAAAAVAVAIPVAAVQPGATAKAFDGSGKHGPQSYTLLTGFEDTEMSDTETRTPALSGTQYGELN